MVHVRPLPIFQNARVLKKKKKITRWKIYDLLFFLFFFTDNTHQLSPPPPQYFPSRGRAKAPPLFIEKQTKIQMQRNENSQLHSDSKPLPLRNIQK